MKKLFLSSLAIAGMLTLFPDTASAHGGQYRGPGDVVPPSTGGGGGRRGPKTPGPSAPGPTTPGPAAPGPTTPGPSGPGPVTGGGAAPGGAPGGPTTPGRGIEVGPDLSKWQFWWEFNKDPYINLKDAIHAPVTITGTDSFFLGATRKRDSKDTAKPSQTDIQTVILPALNKALDDTENRDITSSCFIAMAKIGQNYDTIDILESFKKSLTSNDQEIRETAALAMGISGMPEATDDLVAMATDSDVGRKLTGRASVDNRTRSFAIYGLGMIAYAHEATEVKTKVLKALKTILDKEKDGDRNILVATINSISLLNWNQDNDKEELADTLKTLDTFDSQKFTRGNQLIQSHVAPAIAKLLGRGDSDLHKRYKEKYAKALFPKKKTGLDLYRAAAIALGQLALPNETGKEDDSKYSKVLLKYYKEGRDEQTKYFSLMSLGQIGGNANRGDLLKVLAKGNKALVKPWAAMALGVYSFHKMENDANAVPDETIGSAISKEFRRVKNPEALAAFAVSLGLCKYRDSATDLLDMLAKKSKQDELAGYLCIGLALMDFQKAKTDIHNLVRDSVRRPERLKQAAIALGKLGDKTVTNTLTEMLQEKESNLAKLSAISAALGFIGDRRTIAPLKSMLFNTQLTDLSRAFAAVALGGVADKEKLPWNSKISRNMNYRGSVETLTQSGSGVLDIL